MKKTTEIFSNEVHEKWNKEYEVCGEYINNKTPILMRHCICGKEYLVRPDNFLKGTRCPNCFGNNSYSTESFTRKVNELSDGEYNIVGDYINTTTKIGFVHKKCGYSFDMRPDSFIAGQRCPFCSKHVKYTAETFERSVRAEMNLKHILRRMEVSYLVQFHRRQII